MFIGQVEKCFQAKFIHYFFFFFFRFTLSTYHSKGKHNSVLFSMLYMQYFENVLIKDRLRTALVFAKSQATKSLFFSRRILIKIKP